MALSFDYPVSNVSPFTYRDGETFLEQLARIRDYLNQAITDLNAAINSDHNAWVAAIAALQTQMNTEFATWSTYWTSIIEGLQENSFTAFDPTNGTWVESVNQVISNVYDNVRIYAYFASQLDNFEYTAAEWDAIGYTARHFDLGLAYSPIQLNDINTPTPVTPH